MRAHTITTKASTIVPGGILALGLAVVLLAATASTASAGYSSLRLRPWYCPPPATPSITFEKARECWHFLNHFGSGFADRQVGTSSPAQPFVLGVWGDDSFNPTISVSGDYAQTNNCPPTLPASALPQYEVCLINVTFPPPAPGPGTAP